MKRCLYKIISESPSKEGEAFREQFEREHPEINFRECKNKCSGYFGYIGKDECPNYRKSQ